MKTTMMELWLCLDSVTQKRSATWYTENTGLNFESRTLIGDGSSLNPLTPNTDLQIISPHDISP